MTDLEQSRLKVVRDHMALEITHEWDAVIDTFQHPRYELYGNGTIFDGEEAVRTEGQTLWNARAWRQNGNDIGLKQPPGRLTAFPRALWPEIAAILSSAGFDRFGPAQRQKS